MVGRSALRTNATERATKPDSVAAAWVLRWEAVPEWAGAVVVAWDAVGNPLIPLERNMKTLSKITILLISATLAGSVFARGPGGGGGGMGGGGMGGGMGMSSGSGSQSQNQYRHQYRNQSGDGTGQGMQTRTQTRDPASNPTGVPLQTRTRTQTPAVDAAPIVPTN